MRQIFAAAALAAVTVAAGTLQAQEFEGVITVHMTGTMRDGTPMPDLEYMARGGKMRINAKSPMGSMGIIAVPGDKKLYVLMDAQSMYMEQPLSLTPGTTASTMPALTITRTGKKETIAGYECEHVTITEKANTMDVCMARGLGPFLTAAAAMPGATMPGWQKALVDDGGFPLKVTKGDGTTQLEVTKIEKKRLTEKMFTVPDNYTKMDMPPGRRF
jgi:hypothetical protein